MKPIAKSTARWAPFVADELKKAGLPFPPELILAVIDVESRGVPGLLNPKSGASGLMQVMPIALQSYNAAHSVKYSIDDMRARDNPIAQIRVGLWILGQFWRTAHRYLSGRLTSIPMDELAQISDLMYAAGPAAVKKLLNQLPVPTVDALRNRFPNWNALPHIVNVFDRVSPSAISDTAVSQWISSSTRSSYPIQQKQNWIVNLAIGLVIGWIVDMVIKKFRK